MNVLGILISFNALVGMFNPAIPFDDIAFIDVIIKALIGLVMLFSKNPLQGKSNHKLPM